MTTPTQRNGGPAVEAHGLSKSFGSTRALSDLDLSVPSGTVLGLLGHNGAGKTTAVRILTTLLLADSGSARVAGRDVAREPGEVRQRISLAGQQATLDERLTGRENLILLARLQRLSKGGARARAAEMLERFGLVDAADRQVGTYSGGMRRRLDLAACMIVPRPVVFLDEPTTGLDPSSRADMWASIRGLVDDGAALVLTTQYLEEADRLADHIVVLSEGRTVAEGSPRELKARVGDRRVEVALAGPDSVDAAIDALAPRGLDVDVDRREGRLSVPAPEGPADLETALAALRGAGVPVEEAALSRPTLDDAFFALTGHAHRDAAPGGAEGSERPAAIAQARR